jgi:hypothetical protein
MKTVYSFAIIFLVVSQSLYSQYINLPANIAWNGPNVVAGGTTVDDVEAAFNYGRTHENTALGTNLPAINFPTNAVWNTMSLQEKSLWIINKERVDRGLVPFEACVDELMGITQNYAQYLFDNDTTGHIADGHNALYRLQQNATVNSCMQAYAENIAYTYSGYANAPTNAVERMIYWLIYEDAASSWGHRKNFFVSTYNDDSGVLGAEGLLGVGYVEGSDYRTWLTGAVVVFDIIDPCSSWVYPPVSIQENQKDISIENKNNEILLQSDFILQSIAIIDNQGKIVKQFDGNVRQISTIELSKGLYHIQLVTKDGTTILKEFIK